MADLAAILAAILMFLSGGPSQPSQYCPAHVSGMRSPAECAQYVADHQAAPGR